MKRIKKTDFIFISRTEQWEYTASINGVSAIGSSETSAERNLLRLIVFGDVNKKPICDKY